MSHAEGAEADSVFRTCSDPVRLFWYQNFSGATVQIRVFIWGGNNSPNNSVQNSAFIRAFHGRILRAQILPPRSGWNLKCCSISVGGFFPKYRFWVSFWCTGSDPVQKETQKPDRTHQNIRTGSKLMRNMLSASALSWPKDTPHPLHWVFEYVS